MSDESVPHPENSRSSGVGVSPRRDNRRRFERYRIDLPCRFSVNANLLIKGNVTDLSTGGCRMTSPVNPLTPYTYVEIDIQCLVDDCSLAVELAVVRWVTRQEFGVEFIRMAPLQQERLRHIVAFIETGHRIRTGENPGLLRATEGSL